ncbi:putative glutamate-cysteine ligase [Clavispora lusitaniae]|uniref:Glutamate-cysteine ligase n=1 Tax=Clavispora lusitaniae TaxID=36911 RepID=A0ACD0WS06_CLALS|nr:hypothetical protein E0198_005214 [Clavispora lusitaniae]KAF7580475.1 Glutamate-cysteine ligase family protein [Clavispora lusitaniae]QFZ30347.1 putative glutamate-cysteine ligase [Clavispora lusitaniae]QFZ36009.1 putative glutamate-cysteine ligase [Clavispora lusitaniae]QFZ41693.1 putative glutamate-cysteine ligase [Clavispora lusitaniae]
MGLLSLGTPLDWHEARKLNEHVRNNGIEQLVNIFRQHGGRSGDHYFWGDEVEYMLISVDEKNHRATLVIDQDFILDDLNDPEKPEGVLAAERNVSFHPEYGRFMIEATPLRPYDGAKLGDYLYVEKNMLDRRLVAQSVLPSHVVPLTLTAFPRMGCGIFTDPPAKPIGPASQSLFLPDEIINRHVRFPTLTANIRKRRGHKVAMNIPFYPDVNTKLLDDSIPQRDLFPSDKEPALGAAKPGHVYMDSMGFGMGSSCLQVTMQAANMAQARYLYDALAPLTPVMLAVSAAAPIFKGFLVDQDVRWNVISGAVDDRTFAERDEEPYAGYEFFGGLDVPEEVKSHFQALGGGRGLNGDAVVNKFGDTGVKTVDGRSVQKIPKSRYDSIDSYLGDEAYRREGFFRPAYNDINSPLNGAVYERLVSEKFDEPLARHFAHLFVRDPLVIFNERVAQDNLSDNDHFENIQSTNWQTLRFKPPALYKDATPEELARTPGWRVEFRPLEIQLTDFENAAFSVFIALAGAAILAYNPDWYIPISKIDANMKTAHKVDAATKEKFWFRNPTTCGLRNDDFKAYDLSWFDRFTTPGNDASAAYTNGYVTQDEVSSNVTDVKMTANEIVNGTDSFPGLIRMIVRYVAAELAPKAKVSELVTLQSYLQLVSMRAAGKIPTTARFLRNFVLDHPAYQRDSKVSDAINYDLVAETVAISRLDKPALSRFLGPMADLAQEVSERQSKTEIRS